MKLTDKDLRRLKEARDQGCMHGYSLGPACPFCVSDRTKIPISKFPGWMYDPNVQEPTL